MNVARFLNGSEMLFENLRSDEDHGPECGRIPADEGSVLPRL
jgi:hypothetical protein